jgi:hypothetical protein
MAQTTDHARDFLRWESGSSAIESESASRAHGTQGRRPPWATQWRNHALIARVCFDDRTWTRYWLPEVFRANLTADVLDELDSPGVRAEHERFMELKVRPDREFWRGLLRIKEPVVLTH